MITKGDIRIDRKRDETNTSTVVEAYVMTSKSLMISDILARKSRGGGGVLFSRIESGLKDEILDHVYGEKDKAIAALQSALKSCLALLDHDETDNGHIDICSVKGHAALAMTKNSGRA